MYRILSLVTNNFRQLLRRTGRATDWHVIALYIGLGLLILLPLLRPGYILTFDMTWGPIRPAQSIWSNTYVLNELLRLLAVIMPAWLVQKLLLLAIFALAGIGAHRLAALAPNGAGTWVPYAAGLVYVLNPFVYTRFMTGQWLVLAGYALAPWVVAALWRLWNQQSWHRAWPAVLWLGVLGLFSIHLFGMALIIATGVVLAACVTRAWRRLRWLGVAIGCAVAVNAWWIVGILLGNEVSERIAGFGPDQLQAFATQASVLQNVPLSAVLLQGFWADGQGRYLLPSSGGWLWGVTATLLLTAVCIGIYRIWYLRDRLGLTLMAIGISSLILALGTGWSVTAPLAEWMSAHLPFYAGFREPQKWLVGLALLYAYGFAAGLTHCATWLRPVWRDYVAVLMVVPAVFGGVLLFGGRGQLVSSHYPAGWLETRQVLRQRPESSAVLVLPWNMYLPVSFTNRTVANPARQYFAGPLLISNDPELRGVAPEQGDALHQQAAAFATRRDGRAWQYLRDHDVTRVLVLKEHDWQRYGWIVRQPGVSRLHETDATIVYGVEPSRGR